VKAIGDDTCSKSGISFRAVPSRFGSPYLEVRRVVLFARDNGSVVDLVRFTRHTFELGDEGVAALFGLEPACMVVESPILNSWACSEILPNEVTSHHIDLREGTLGLGSHCLAWF
jgi:hypothetical protein